MNAEFDQLVRDSMSQFTDEVTLPAGLADRARRHVRSQRQARAGWLTGAVAASVTAVLVITAAGQAPTRSSTGQALRAQLTAQVIRHVVKALTKTAATNPVEYVRSSITGWRYYIGESTPIRHLTFQIRVTSSVDWFRGGVNHGQSYSPAGRLTLESLSVRGKHKSSVVTISYPNRIWWRDISRNDGPLPTGPVTSCVLDVEPYWTPAQWASQLKKLVSCGNVQVQGRQWVDGVDAIRLRTHTKRVRTCGIVVTLANGTREHRCEWGIAGYPGTLFINPSTYLPIRYVYHGHGSEQFDFGFLPPNRTNLAKLRMAIPPGFQHA